MNKTFIAACITAVAVSIRTSPISQMSPAHSFAELLSSNHTCLSSSNRNKADLVDFWSFQNGSEKYSDSDFTPDKSALFWSEFGEHKMELKEIASDVTWKRIGEAYDSSYSLFGDKGIVPGDIVQGELGDCWLLAGASAVAEKPGRIKKLFVNNELSDNGIYAVNFFTMGLPHTVIVDDYLPFIEGKPVMASHGKDKSLWMSIMEKAWAKYHGNYWHLSGGNSNEAVRTLTNVPHIYKWHSEFSTDQIWESLKEADKQNDVITTGTSNGDGIKTDTDSNENGVAYGHAFTLIGVLELTTGEKLVQIRNPWGSETYKGAWSDKSN
jgi:hypothetical protein